MPPVGRPRKKRKLRYPFSGLLAKRGVDTAWLVEHSREFYRRKITQRCAESWVQGERRPEWPELVLDKIDKMRGKI